MEKSKFERRDQLAYDVQKLRKELEGKNEELKNINQACNDDSGLLKTRIEFDYLNFQERAEFLRKGGQIV